MKESIEKKNELEINSVKREILEFIFKNEIRIKICDYSMILGEPVVNTIKIFFYLKALVQENGGIMKDLVSEIRRS